MKIQINPITFPTCMECKNHQKNCCNDSPRVPLLISDIKKIISLGFKTEDFLLAGEYSKERIKNDEDRWKNSMIDINGKLFKINTKKKPNGNCFFLDDGVGCILGEFRPTVCKIYPFWLNKQNNIIYEKGEKGFCFFGKQGLTTTDGAKLIKENKESIKYYFDQIKTDCIQNNTDHKKLIIEILNKNNN